MKVLLIISQYRWSRHMFIVESKSDDQEYLKVSQKLIEELEDYKRISINRGDYNYGDMQEPFFGGMKRRHNVNDSGDIYFIPCISITHALKEIKEYWDTSRRESRGYKKRELEKSVDDHHNVAIIRDIVSRHFNIL